MKFISTRHNQISKTLSEAIFMGLSEDGGLFLPEHFPQVDLNDFSAELSYPEFAAQTLKGFFENDLLEPHLLQICQNAFNFPLPLQTLNKNTFVLELFHGPTSSFKDFGARFLAECLNIISSHKKTTIMVATSGDTGSAVASAFYKKNNVNVIILYPHKQISERQEHQITCWGDNVIGLAVQGSFDDCQHLVKTAFTDPWWKNEMKLSSANSINIGRLLPQMIYYAYTSLQFYERSKTAAGFIIPTGNLGNATAAYWAKQMGFPIREIVLATNANTTIPDYLQTGNYQPRASISTLANAMDVGNPSNFERLSFLFKPYESFKKNVSAISVDDEAIQKTIQAIYQETQMIICPHTATACFARKALSEEPWIVVATADPCKFDTVIEPLIHTQVPVAPALQALLHKPTHVQVIDKTLEAIQAAIVSHDK
jgi:threonine synthase